MGNSVYDLGRCGIDEKDGTLVWIIELVFKSPIPESIKSFSKIFTGYGENWREADDESIPVSEQLIAKLNAIASEEALKIIRMSED